MERARRVAVDDPAAAAADYADSFRLDLAEPDTRSAEQWLRDALERSPAVRWIVLVVHRHVLRFELGPLDDDHVIGWRIAGSEPDVVRLQASSPLFRGQIEGRRFGGTATTVTTTLRYGRPVLSRVIWTIVGPLHRRIAPYLLERAAGVSRRTSV
jgi:hypothetical protein